MMLTNMLCLVIQGVFGFPSNCYRMQMNYEIIRKMERGTKSIYLVTLEIQSEQDYQYDVIKDNGKLRRCVGHINPSRFEYASYHDETISLINYHYHRRE